MKDRVQLKLVGVLWATLLAATPGDPPPVAEAAMNGDLDAVRTLLRDGADVNAPQGDGMTALHWAAENGDVEMVKVLLYAGANREAVTRIGDYRPLHLASQAGQAGTVGVLLEAGSEPNPATTTGGALPIHFAAASGSVGAVQALLDHGADPNAREPLHGQTPLIFAASYGRLEVVQALIERGADVSLETLVEDTSESGRERSVARSRRNAVLAAFHEDEEGRASGYTVEEVQTAMRAARMKRAIPDDVQEEEEEVDPDEFRFGQTGGFGGMTALLHAVREGHTDVAMALLDAGADIEQTGTGENFNPLMMAIVNGRFDLAMRLLDRGADPNFKSNSGDSPIYAVLDAHWAPKSTGRPRQRAYEQQETTHLQLIERLLQMGVDPNVRLTGQPPYESRAYLSVNVTGATPFWRAAYGTDLPAMQLLVRYGADPSITTKNTGGRGRRGGGGGRGGGRGGRRGAPAAQAPGTGAPAVAPQEPPAEPEEPATPPEEGPGVFPIHAASGVGYGQGFAGNSHRHAPDGWLPSVRYLVDELGADVNALDPNGYTALHHAASRGDNELIMFLVERGADVTILSRRGQTVADMANAPSQRLRVFPETIELLQKLGSGFNPKPK